MTAFIIVQVNGLQSGYSTDITRYFFHQRVEIFSLCLNSIKNHIEHFVSFRFEMLIVTDAQLLTALVAPCCKVLGKNLFDLDAT